MITIERYYSFHAAHRLFSAGEKCARIHGHTYNVVVTVNSSITDSSEILTPFAYIDSICEPIIHLFDHVLMLSKTDPLQDILNAHNEFFIELPYEPSSENLAKYIYEKISSTGAIKILSVSISETKSSKVTYFG